MNSGTTQDTGAPQGRRSFLGWFLGATVTALFTSIAYPVARFLGTPSQPEVAASQVQVGLTDDPDFAAKGFKIVRFGSEPVIVIKLSDTDIRAFSAVCTHLACIVGYRKKKHDIYCNCHGGTYDLQGRNIAGPPPRPLTPYKVNIVAKAGQPGTIFISKA